MLQYSPIQTFTAAFVLSMQLYRPRHKTACRALQGRFQQFDPINRPRYQTDTSGYNAACATLERITTPGRFAQIPGATATPDAVQVSTATDHASPAGSAPTVCGSLASAAPCAPADVSASPPVRGQPGGGLDASHARRLAVWHRVSGQSGHSGTIHPAEQSSGRGTAGGAESLTALAAALFRAFAR